MISHAYGVQLPQAIEAHAAAKFRIGLILLNLCTFIGTYFYRYAVSEETACDILLEQHLAANANCTLVCSA